MTIIRLIHAGVSAFVGYSAFLAFIVLHNYPSAILGIISGATDSISFILHYQFRKRRLSEWYERKDLRYICRLGIVIATIGLLNLGYHTTIQIMLKKPILPVANSSVISIIWSSIAMRSGIVLLCYGISYQKSYEEGTSLLEDQCEDNDAVEEVVAVASGSNTLPSDIC